MRTLSLQLLAGLTISCAFFLGGCAAVESGDRSYHAANLTAVDRYTLAGGKHLLHDYPPLDASGNINVVIEIPAGTNDKWEVDKTSGQLKWEIRKNKPRVVSYLAYPGNYGMIPRTLLPKELGGDGDPLDVIIIGPAVPRGSVISARPIGILNLLDDGEQDDKIIAVLVDSELGGVLSIEELNRNYNGAAQILQLWFSNYKGPGRMQSNGFGDVKQAQTVIKAAIDAYTK